MTALAPNTLGFGEELTPEEWDSVIYGPLVAASAVLGIPGLHMHESSFPVHLPKMDHAEPDETAWLGPNTQIVPDDMTTSEVVLMARGLKALKVIVRFSNETVRSSVDGPLEAARATITQRLTAKIDRALIAGDSTAGITGLIPSAGTTLHYSTGNVLDELQDAMTAALDASASPSIWLVNTRTIGALYKVRDTLGHSLLVPNPAQAGSDMLLGRPVTASPHVPVGTAVLIDADQVHACRDLDGSARFLFETYAAWDQTALRVVSRWDVGIVHALGVVVVDGLGPA